MPKPSELSYILSLAEENATIEKEDEGYRFNYKYFLVNNFPLYLSCIIRGSAGCRREK
jgi:hypothetical protein